MLRKLRITSIEVKCIAVVTPVVIVASGDATVLQGQPEFLGRCTATPQVKLEEEAYDPAQLDWFDVYRGILRAGQLLASFELLEASQTLNIHGTFMLCLHNLLYSL